MEFFDLAFMCKSHSQVAAFEAWHAARRAVPEPWDFDAELVAYCQNDVLMLGKLVREYHDICMETFHASPWFHATAPSYVHAVVKRRVSTGYELPQDTQSDEYKRAVNETAWERGWGVLRANEYWFARAALRGGRTEVRKIHHRVSDEDWARGVRIRYQDIVSMYPYVQVARDYPVGLPTIEVYDAACYPCTIHKNPDRGNYIAPNCGCFLAGKEFDHDRDKSLEIVKKLGRQPSLQEIMDPEFFGIVCASVSPPRDLFHPVLVTWDAEEEKCVGTLEPIKFGVFTTVEFQKALQKGYRLDRLHRLDRYNRAPGLWNDFIKQLYVFKMANSEAAPATPEAKLQLAATYEADFAMGDAVTESYPGWAKRAAKRQVFKIMLNSGWGKHCQRPNMPQTMMFDEADHSGQDELLLNYTEGLVQLKTYQRIGQRICATTDKLGKYTMPSFHDTYLPAGLFVPAYGRLMLYEQLERLGERALYHDTDSIIYIYEPAKYNIPESPVWGRWSVEDFDTDNGGIREFVGVGPKSYGLLAENGCNYIKVKGLSLKRAHEPILNFFKMRDMVIQHLAGQPVIPLQLPQFTFRWSLSSNMVTAPMVKLFSFQPNVLKGFLRGATLFPHGYHFPTNTGRSPNSSNAPTNNNPND